MTLPDALRVAAGRLPTVRLARWSSLMRRLRFACLVAVGLLAAGCSSSPSVVAPAPIPEAPVEAPPAEVVKPPTTEVTETWVGQPRPEEGIVALAGWTGGGDRAWVIAAAAGTDRLLVFDAVTGEALVEHGSTGEIAGRFRRPAAVAVVGDLALVAEETGGRIQVLRLPGLSTAGFLGAGMLVAPTLLAAAPDGDGYEVWVADRAETGGRAEIVRLRFTLDGDSLRGEVGAPVATTRSGSETLTPLAAMGVDAVRERLLVVEQGREGGGVWIIDREGRFAGRAAEGLAGGPPGLALFPCGAEGGWWIVAEPGDGPTRFLLLDRATLEPVASFTGAVTTGSRRVSVLPAGTPGFPAGAVYAVDGAGAVSAFSWGDVAAALGLDDCGR